MKNNFLKVKLSEKEIKDYLLNILKEFDNFCKKHKLSYFLGGGTLLGAIRHEGFIPWDDDIDVMMNRTDYEKLLKLYPIKESKNSPYEIQDHHIKEGYFIPFARLVDTRVIVDYPDQSIYLKGKYQHLYNLYIDIFPIDGVPLSPLKQRVLFKKVKILKLGRLLAARRFFYIYPGKNSFSKTLKSIFHLPYKLITKIVGYKFFLNKIESLSKKYPYEFSQFVAPITGIYGMKEIVPKEVFSEKIMVKFVDSLFPAPIGYDLYLRKHYGNYMQLPPPEKQVNHFGGGIYKIKEQMIEEEIYEN